MVFQSINIPANPLPNAAQLIVGAPAPLPALQMQDKVKNSQRAAEISAQLDATEGLTIEKVVEIYEAYIKEMYAEKDRVWFARFEALERERVALEEESARLKKERESRMRKFKEEVRALEAESRALQAERGALKGELAEGEGA